MHVLPPCHELPSHQPFYQPSLCTLSPPHSTSTIKKNLPKHLIQKPIKPIRLRLLHKRAMVLFNLREIRDQIRFVRFHEFGALDEFPADEEDGEYEDPGIRVS